MSNNNNNNNNVFFVAVQGFKLNIIRFLWLKEVKSMLLTQQFKIPFKCITNKLYNVTIIVVILTMDHGDLDTMNPQRVITSVLPCSQLYGAV